MRMNTGEGFSYTNAQKAEMKNLFPEIKELKEELADIDSRLDRHKQTQDAVNQYQKALEANEITYEQFAKPKIEAEVAKLDKSTLGENEYNTEVLRIEEKFKPVNPNEKRAIDKILELQGGYINDLRKQYKPIEGSELTKERWDAAVDAEVAKMMETYNAEISDSFAAYLKQNLRLRTGDILRREGTVSYTQLTLPTKRIV